MSRHSYFRPAKLNVSCGPNLRGKRLHCVNVYFQKRHGAVKQSLWQWLKNWPQWNQLKLYRRLQNSTPCFDTFLSTQPPRSSMTCCAGVYRMATVPNFVKFVRCFDFRSFERCKRTF